MADCSPVGQAAARESGPAALAAIDELAASFFDRYELPAMVYGVVTDGVLSHWWGAGSRSPDPNTVFRIASMTKSFTAAALLMLRDEGALGLEDEVAKWVPELHGISGPTIDSPPLTVRHLLTMAAGWIEDDPWADRQLAATAGELGSWLAQMPRHAQGIGTHFEYSNLGYAALGRVIANASGQRFQDFVSQRLLGPLEMHDTVWCIDQLKPTATVATGHHRTDVEAALADGEFASMGGLWSTVADLARWVGFFTDAFPARNDPDDGPLRRSSRREQQQVARSFPPVLRRLGLDGHWRLESGGYGMGLNAVEDLGLGSVVFHGGGLPGFGSAMAWLPARGVGIVALANRTYAPMIPFATEALELLGRHDALQPVRRSPASGSETAILTMADRLGALFESWNNAVAAELFAMNVDLDEPLAARAAAAERLRASHGGLRVQEVSVLDGARGRVRLEGATGHVTVSFRLSPLAEPRIQHYSILDSVEPDERLLSAARRLLVGDRLAELASPKLDPALLNDLLTKQRAAFGQADLGEVVASVGPLNATFSVHCPATELLLDVAIDESGRIDQASFAHPTRRPAY